MSDDPTRPNDATPPDPDAPGAAPGPEAQQWLAQLQHMIDRIAAEAGPIARDVAAKAAELAAVAGEKAGPIARRAAEVTGDVGTKVAERSRRLADDLRHRAAEGSPGEPPAGAGEPPSEAAAPTAPEPPAG